VACSLFEIINSKGDTMLIKTDLSPLELKIIDDILNNKIEGTKETAMSYPTVAHIVWVENGQVEFGRVRWGYRGNYITNDGTYDSLSASPFPGAWAMVPIFKIVRVSHVKAY
jgi:hypothetical protein